MKRIVNDYELYFLNFVGSCFVIYRLESRVRYMFLGYVSRQVRWWGCFGVFLFQFWRDFRSGLLFLLRNNFRYGQFFWFCWVVLFIRLVFIFCLSVGSCFFFQNYLVVNRFCFCLFEQNLERVGKGQVIDGSSLGGKDLGKLFF